MCLGIKNGKGSGIRSGNDENATHFQKRCWHTGGHHARRSSEKKKGVERESWIGRRGVGLDIRQVSWRARVRREVTFISRGGGSVIATTKSLGKMFPSGEEKPVAKGPYTEIRILAQLSKHIHVGGGGLRAGVVRLEGKALRQVLYLGQFVRCIQPRLPKLNFQEKRPMLR